MRDSCLLRICVRYILLILFLLRHIIHICNYVKQLLRNSNSHINKNSISNCIVFLKQTQHIILTLFKTLSRNRNIKQIHNILRVITHKVTQEITLLITHTIIQRFAGCYHALQTV